MTGSERHDVEASEGTGRVRAAPLPPAYAHTADGRPSSEWHRLDEHLRSVEEVAGAFAAVFQSPEWGRLAGLWHDLGKFRPPFQDYLRGRGGRVDHAVAGALLARHRAKGEEWLPLAFVIAGHHTGLADLRPGSDVEGPTPLLARLADQRKALAEALERAPEWLTERPLPELPERFGKPARRGSAETFRAARSLAFWIRLLFSALVDADFLDTERFHRGDERRRIAGAFQPIAELRRRLDRALDDLAERAPSTEVNRVRAEVLAAVRATAERAPGLFSLSVPTGGGKTLASMSFALRHAERHGLRRVVVVIPLTSILEQNAAVYRRALGDDQVIEHHSNLDPERETRRNKLASENWDAPVVVTTAVQLFESLFANRTSRCRKLHNLVGSVIVLDEAQTLPPELLAPILEALDELHRHYRCSIVLSTATQPALARREALPYGLEGVHEMMPDPAALARRLVRFRTEWRGGREWDELAQELIEHPRVLAIVHRRSDARELAERLPEAGTYHLSALMCAAHRLDVLDRLRQVLADPDRPCRLVSTQLVEAGVDISFPVVYRALAGVDSLLQAGGRCNREGEIDLGRLIVFRAPTAPPPGVPRKGAETTARMLDQHGELDLFSPETVDEYFRSLYQKHDLDRHGVLGALTDFRFATVAHRFRLIEDGYTEPLVVPYGDSARRVDSLRLLGPSRDRLRALQPFVVNVPRRNLDELRASGAVELLHDLVYVLSTGFEDLYQDEYGLGLTPGRGGALIA
ncbi:MAG TPA: CRISPR-associated endonuclease Cas3'' [Thermoanaerobaculia bacterium]|nr:CRISPR-associated endonuclease Cas3'' [Thermoanaerobaculia bacterium]